MGHVTQWNIEDSENADSLLKISLLRKKSVYYVYTMLHYNVL